MRLGVSAGVRARDVGDELTGHRPGFDDGDADTEPLGDRCQELLEPFDGKLAPQYGSANGCPTTPPTLVTVTTRPRPAWRISGSTSWVRATTPM